MMTNKTTRYTMMGKPPPTSTPPTPMADDPQAPSSSVHISGRRQRPSQSHENGNDGLVSNNSLSSRRNSFLRVGSTDDALTAPPIAPVCGDGADVHSAAAGENRIPTKNSNNMTAIDFIASSTAVKHLFSLPYNNDRTMSMALHNLGNGTFLLDSDEDFGSGSADSIHSATGSGSEAASTTTTTTTTNTTADYDSTACSFVEGTILRRGRRRRQRPSSWSISLKSEHADSGTVLSDAADATATTTTCELNSIHLANLREKEQSLLASLTSLLENEDRDKRGEVAKSHHLIANDCGTDDDKKITKENLALMALPSLNEQHKDSATITPSPSNALIVSRNSSNGHLRGMMSESKDINAGNVIESNLPSECGAVSGDPLGNVLHPPQHYLSQYACISPPSEPRQYVNWNFHDMKLLVASDAIIYNQERGGGGGTGGREELTKTDDEVSGSSSSMIAIRIEDVSDLKSQMFDMIESREKSRLIVEDNASEHGRLSYAEALQMPSAKGNHHKQLIRQNEGVDLDNFVHVAAENVELITSIIPSLGVEPQPLEWAARLGFSHSPYRPEPVANNGDRDRGASIEAKHAQSSPEAGVGYEGPKISERATISSTSPASSSLPLVSSAPICTVLDAYLDNLMANVPQLALILQEHGFVQNIKLLNTEDIPSLLLHPSTLGGETSSSATQYDPLPSPIFSPDIVEMNAAMLLRFLKTNCTRENSTYLLHRAAGEASIQLFDVSSISKMRQRKWVWWLALCSYRFACRLDQLRTNVLSPHEDVLQREYRRRQRSLLQNTLDLLEELADMEGGRRHDTIGAAVCEHLADTYLWSADETDLGKEEGVQRTDFSSDKPPSPCASSSQPYRKITADCLNKAHDHLMNGVNKLTPLLAKARQDHSPIEIEALSSQLYGIYHKVVNVNLRLADRHLKSYFSSNLIQNLRLAARILSEAVILLDEFSAPQRDRKVYTRSIILQYSWMWEYCGHYARSFASDNLWRDRGHTNGADIIGLLREVNLSCGSIRKQCFGAAGWKPKISIEVSSHGQVSLNSLSGIVVLPKDFEQIDASVLQNEGCPEAIGAAKTILDQKTQIKRDALLVLVAASLCFGHSIDSYVFLNSCAGSELRDCYETKNDNTAERQRGETMDGVDLFSSIPGGTAAISSLLRRLGDACNEVGKILLHESREVLLPQYVTPSNVSGISTSSSGLSHVSAIMLSSAKFWFDEGLEKFTQGKDARNTALLRCNLCQCCKIRANTNVILPGTSEGDSKRNSSEQNLQEAVENLVLAHEALGQRDIDPITWDMVSEELAATLLVLGVRRRQSLLSSSSEPLQFQALRLSPGEEKAIVEPMERSCKIYESLGTARSNHQAAAAHYQLALYFSKVWTCQRDESKTREKLSAAFMHYGLAYQYFSKHIAGNQTTFVMLSLDFSNLYSSVSGDECLSKALMCCLDTRAAFSLPITPEITEQMAVLAENVEARVLKLLLGLIKIVKESNRADKYKDLYREALRQKVISARSNETLTEESHPTLHVFELLQSLHDLYHKPQQ